MKNKKHFPSVVQEKAHELLRERSIQITLKQISEETGLTEAWLSLFISGGIKEASGGKTETVCKYFGLEIKI